MHLESRFATSNGSRKYRLNRDIYELNQSGMMISEYYTAMKCMGVDLNAMDVLSRITTLTEEITSFLNAITKQKEEHKLFQFLFFDN